MTGIAALSYLGINNYRRILPGSDRSHQAILEAQDAVKRSFGTGTTVHFWPRESIKVEPSAGGFKISGYLDAISADGKLSQAYTYSCMVTQNLIGNWSVTNLNLDITEAPVPLK